MSFPFLSSMNILLVVHTSNHVQRHGKQIETRLSEPSPGVCWSRLKFCGYQLL